MYKVEAAYNLTYVFGETHKVKINIKKGQRWYVVSEGDVYYLERDNVIMPIAKEEFDSLFAPSKRSGKYG